MAAWREITDTAWDHGIAPDDSQTPRRAAARVVRLGGLEGPAAAAVHRVAGAVEQVLYAPEPGGAVAPAEDVREVREGLRSSAGRWDRLRATLAPRSAVRVIGAVSYTAGCAARHDSGADPLARPREPGPGRVETWHGEARAGRRPAGGGAQVDARPVEAGQVRAPRSPGGHRVGAQSPAGERVRGGRRDATAPHV